MKVVTVHQLQSALENGGKAYLIDVRTPVEFAGIHVPGARSLPLDQLDCKRVLSEHQGKQESPLYILCQGGTRAQKAAQKFAAAGFDDCAVVEGGTQAWIDAGLPVDRGVSKVLPLMRQVQITIGFISAAGAALALTFDSRFAIVPLLTGCGLLFAGLTGYCGLAMLLAKMPWNQVGYCDAGTCCETKN